MNKIETHDTMSPEAQRIAIAEACGWWGNVNGLHMRPPLNNSEYCEVPDYLNDLNACREFETWLLKNHPDLRAVYRRILIECVGSDGFYWMAKAAQRCEAFLKTIGKWEGEA